MPVKFQLTIEGQQLEVEVLSVKPPHAQVTVDGILYQVELPDNRSLPPPASLATTPVRHAPATPAPMAPGGRIAATGAPGEVTAPMPGKILKLLVREGDSIAAGQPVCVLEAMKMENYLPAPIGGRVARLTVPEGDDVRERTVLAVIEG